jgi:hypothetical protein
MSKTNLTVYTTNGGLILANVEHESWGDYTLYLTGTLNDDYLETKQDRNSALVFRPLEMTVVENKEEDDDVVEDDAPTESDNRYRITNTPSTNPSTNQTSLTVRKQWDAPNDSLYRNAEVTFDLYRNGMYYDSITVNGRDNWTAVFEKLPLKDKDGNNYTYTVVENRNTEDWIPIYGDVVLVGGRNPTYETTVTNRYRWTDAYELPSTGGIGTPIYMLCGLILTLAPLVYGLSLRRKYERRSEE